MALYSLMRCFKADQVWILFFDFEIKFKINTFNYVQLSKKSRFVDIVWELNITRKPALHYTEKIREVIINYVEPTSEKIIKYDAIGNPKVLRSMKSFFET
jgi:hypothetical protein